MQIDKIVPTVRSIRQASSRIDPYNSIIAAMTADDGNTGIGYGSSYLKRGLQKMQKRKIGKSNLEVSALGLGCMGMSLEQQSNLRPMIFARSTAQHQRSRYKEIVTPKSWSKRPVAERRRIPILIRTEMNPTGG